MSDAITIQPLGDQPLSSSVSVPGSKSYTNRALMVAGLAQGKSTIDGALFSDDTRHMAAALNQLGVHVASDEGRCSFEVEGSGGRFLDADIELFVGNAGTAARFLSACLSLGTGNYRVDGVARMRERPMSDLFAALRALGVTVAEHGQPGCLPATISGRTRRTGDVRLAVAGNASSQFLSGLLLAAPCWGGNVVVDVTSELVSKPYLDLTIDVMSSFGVRVDNHGYRSFEVPPEQVYRGCHYGVEPDASAASYFFAAAAICGGSVTVEGLGTDSRQGDFKLVDILERMGAQVIREPRRTTLRGSGKLRGVDVDMSDLTDVAQTLAVVAPFAEGPTRITGIGFIRHKETDRVGNVVKELRRLSIEAKEEDDGYVVYPGVPQAGEVETYDDHRMAMSFALLGLKAPGITIKNPACTSKTFPHYFEVLDRLRTRT